jgi:hypothetical protein
VAAVIARLLRKKAAAKVAAKKVGKVRMMTPGDDDPYAVPTLPATGGGGIGFRVDDPSISIRVTKKVAQNQRNILCGIDEATHRENKNASS